MRTVQLGVVQGYLHLLVVVTFGILGPGARLLARVFPWQGGPVQGYLHGVTCEELRWLDLSAHKGIYVKSDAVWSMQGYLHCRCVPCVLCP